MTRQSFQSRVDRPKLTAAELQDGHYLLRSDLVGEDAARVLPPGLTPKAVREKLATIQMLDVWLSTTDGRWLVMPRFTQPEPDQAILLHKLKLELPQQPPPRIKRRELWMGIQPEVPTFSIGSLKNEELSCSFLTLLPQTG